VKGKFLLYVLAFLLPVPLVGQVAKPTTPAADAATAFKHFELYAGYAYSSANQVKGSSSLTGFNITADAKWKPWFGGQMDFGQYGNSTSSVKPTMTTFLAGPSLYVPSDKFEGFFHVLFGGAHTGGVGATPDISFATAIGGGVQYQVYKTFSLRVSGDGILSSFVLDPNHLGYSANLRVNPRASVGVAYSF